MCVCVWIGIICLRIATVGGLCEHDNESSDSKEAGKLLTKSATGSE